MSLPKIIFIVGPTAVGKSDVAIELSKLVPSEIVSCDSMQIYNEITIASNKPSKEELTQTTHHLINIMSVTEEFDVAQFNERAIKAISDIHIRKLVPIVVGGSGLYMSVLLDGLFEGATRDQKLREELYQELEEKGNEHLYNRLIELDQKTADKLHANDVKRVVRALEVCLTKNAPFSEVKKNRQGLWGKFEIEIFVLDQDRQRLYDKINSRVDQMFEQGLVDEIKQVNELSMSVSATQLIGVKEVLGMLNKEYDIDEAKELMKKNTRHFAKRQLTWFRADERLQWINVNDQSIQETAKIIQQKVTD